MDSKTGVKKGYFWTLKMEFPVVLILGSVDGGEGRKCRTSEKPPCRSVE